MGSRKINFSLEEIEEMAKLPLSLVEKMLGITEVSMEGMRYPVSNYYKIVSDSYLAKVHREVEKFLSKF